MMNENLNIPPKVEDPSFGTIRRKRHLLLFFFVIVFISISPLTLAGVSLWDINTGVYFRATQTGGDIDFNTAITTSQIQVANGLVEFTALTMGGDYISLIGLNASSNCDLTLLDVESDRIVYSIAANIGQTSVTHVKAPSNLEIEDVGQATSWSLDSANNVVTVNTFHWGTKQITVYFNPISQSISQTISAMSDTFMLVVVILSFVMISQIGQGDSTGTSNIIIGFIVGISLIVLLLNFIENLLN